MVEGTIQALLSKGVKILCPESVVFDGIDENNIAPGAVIYPGCVIKGEKTSIGRGAQIGAGGGAYLDNVQMGADAEIMQGVYRDSTVLDGVKIRNGGELRDNCLLEEGAELGHTVGLKQTILFSNVVLGSLINFCDVLMSGGTGRRDHSEVGSCLALYNFTPQGDKFASLFGDVARGVFLRERPIFIGGQTQIVSPVCVGFGSVIGAGSKLTQDVSDDKFVSFPVKEAIKDSVDAELIYSPYRKVRATLIYMANLSLLETWYASVRCPVYAGTESSSIYLSALGRVRACLAEREKRFKKYIEKLPESLRRHRALGNMRQVDEHERALSCAKSHRFQFTMDGSELCEALTARVRGDHMRWDEAVQRLPDDMVRRYRDAFTEAMNAYQEAIL